MRLLFVVSLYEVVIVGNQGQLSEFWQIAGQTKYLDLRFFVLGAHDSERSRDVNDRGGAVEDFV